MFTYIVPRQVAKSNLPDISRMRLEVNRKTQASCQLHDGSRVNKVGDAELVWKDSRKSHAFEVAWKLVKERATFRGLSSSAGLLQACFVFNVVEKIEKGRGGEAIECTCCCQQYLWVNLLGGLS
jgi:hypothetical protein